MVYDRGDSFSFDFEPNGILFGSKSKGKLSRPLRPQLSSVEAVVQRNLMLQQGATTLRELLPLAACNTLPHFWRTKWDILFSLEQWLLTWVRPNPRGWVSQFQGFGGKRFWAIEVKTIKFTTHILFLQLGRVRWMHVWNLWSSVPPTRLRTTAVEPLCYRWITNTLF